MDVFDRTIAAIAARAAAANPPAPGDYPGTDGLLYCGRCHTPKECFVTLHGETLKRACVCRCRSEAQARRKAQEQEQYREQLRTRGGINPAYRFGAADMTPELDKCRRYAQNWEQARRENIGLLLWGDIGTGKTYAAHCVCNAVIDRDEPVAAFVTSLAYVINSGFDRTEILARVSRTPLVVFDDLGAERGSDYALENVFALVDERYKSGKPLIITTNLTLDEIRNPADAAGNPDMRRRRIYDRISELCVPVYFPGGSKRVRPAADKKAAMRKILEI